MGAPLGRVGEFLVNGTPCPVYMNMNTLSRFDELADESLIEVATSIWKAAELLPATPVGGSKEEKERANQQRGLSLIKSIKLRTLHYLAASALHRYDQNGEPMWTYTPGVLGAALTFEQWASLFSILLDGLGNFMPQAKDVPLHAAEAAKKKPNPTEGTPQAPSDESAGGQQSIVSDVAILDSLTTTSEDPPSGESA